MIDELKICPRCSSDAMYTQYSNEEKTEFHKLCFGCGFHSNSFRHKEKVNYEETEELIPSLYKDLRYVDEEGYLWYPITINIPGKGMVFVDGSSITKWKWAAVLPSSEDPKKMDMSTVNHFDERDFLEAIDYIDYFSE